MTRPQQDPTLDLQRLLAELLRRVEALERLVQALDNRLSTHGG